MTWPPWLFLLLIIPIAVTQPQNQGTEKGKGFCTTTLTAAATVGQHHRIIHEVNHGYVEKSMEQLSALTNEFKDDIELFQNEMEDELQYYEKNGNVIYKRQYYYYK